MRSRFGFVPCALAALLLRLNVVSCCSAADPQADSSNEKSAAAVMLQSPLPARRASEDLSLLRRESIRNEPTQDMREAMQRIPGVHVQDFGGPSRTAFPTIRGSLPRHVRVSFDGIPLNYQDEGAANVNLIPLPVVDDILAWKNGSSSVFGSGLAGALQVDSVDPAAVDGHEITIESSHGTWDTTRNAVLAQVRQGAVGVVASGVYDSSDGYRERSGYYDRRGYGKLLLDLPGASRLIVSGGVSDVSLDEFEYPDWGSWDRVEQTARYGQATLELFRTGDVQGEVRVYGFDHFMRRDTNALDGGERFGRMELGGLLTGAATEWSWRRSFQQPTLGLFGVNVLTLGLETERSVVDAKDIDDPVVAEKDGLFLREVLVLGPHSVTLGGRFDSSDAFGDYASWEAGYSVSLLDERCILRANVNRSFSPPPLLWLHLSTPFLQANPDLEPEQALTASVGADVALTEAHWLRVSVFGSEIDNAIARERIAPRRSMMRNHDRHESRGVELELLHRFGRLELEESAFFGEIVDAETGDRVEGRIKRSFQASARYRHPGGWLGSLTGRYVNWNEHEDLEADERHMIWDARLARDFSMGEAEAQAFIEVRNVLDTDWALNFMNEMPGRSVQVGLRVTF